MEDTLIRIKYVINGNEYNDILDLYNSYVFKQLENKYYPIDSLDDKTPRQFNNYIDYIINHLSYNNDVSPQYIKQIKIEHKDEFLHIILNYNNYKSEQNNELINIQNSIYLNYIIHYNIYYNNILITNTITSLHHKTRLYNLNFGNKHNHLYDILCEAMNIILSNEFLKQNNIKYITEYHLKEYTKYNNNIIKSSNRQNMIVVIIINFILILGIMCKYYYDNYFNFKENSSE